MDSTGSVLRFALRRASNNEENVGSFDGRCSPTGTSGETKLEGEEERGGELAPAKAARRDVAPRGGEAEEEEDADSLPGLALE